MEEPRDTVNHDNSSPTERQDGWMKPERGSEQHVEPVWKHERGEKGGKKKEKDCGNETMGARTERRGAHVRKE